MASEIKLTNLAVHLIAPSAGIDRVRATENPEAFIPLLILRYNEQKRKENKPNSYNYKPVQKLQWNPAHEGMHLKAYYSKRPHKENSAELLNALSKKNYGEEFAAYQLHFAYFLYFVVPKRKQGGNQQKIKKVWALFVLTTNDAYRLVRPCCDYRFPSRVAFRIIDPPFHKKEIKSSIENKEGDVSTYKELFDLNLKLNAYSWILYKNFDAAVKPGSSLHHTLGLSTEEKIQLHIGEGMIRIGGGYTLKDYEKILPLLSNIKRKKVTKRLDGTQEKDDPAFQTFANFRRVNMGKQKKLDSQLVQLIWKAVTTEDPLPSLYLSHRYYHQYYRSTSFRLSIHSENIKKSCKWTYPPIFKELVDQLKDHLLGTLSFKEFAAVIASISLKCNEMGSQYPLEQYIQGKVVYEGKTYYRMEYRMEGAWLEISNQHLETKDRPRLEKKLEPLQSLSIAELTEAKIEHPDKTLKNLKKEGYLDKDSKLTDKFLRETKTAFEKTLNTPELYEVLMRRCSLYNSMIAKLEIIKLFGDFNGTNFTFQIHQLDRPGKVATHSNHPTSDEAFTTTPLSQGKVECEEAAQTPSTLEELFSQLLGQKDPYSAYLVLESLKKAKDFPKPNQKVTEETLIESAELLKKTLIFINKSEVSAALNNNLDIVIIKADENYYLPDGASIPAYEGSSKNFQKMLNRYKPAIQKSVGLTNSSNDCFLNATLQVLFRTKFHQILFKNPKEDIPLSWALRAFSLQYEFSGVPLSTNYLRGSFKNISQNTQEDAAEVLGEIFDAFNLDGEAPIFNIARKPFENKVSVKKGPENVSTLEELANQQDTLPIIKLPIRKKGATFEDCWEAFEHSENKDEFTYRVGDKVWQSTSFKQTSTLKNKPTFLCIQFLRFTKNKKKISTPLSLDPTQPLKIIGTHYEITAAIVHEGATCKSGHYTSIIKINDNWELFNDTSITKMEKRDTIFKFLNQAYILLLKKKRARRGQNKKAKP